MRSLGRKLANLLAIVFLLPVAAKALIATLAEPPRALSARWSSAGILDPATSDPQARLIVFAARTAGWRGLVAVHSWIVIKGENADRYHRYEVTGWGDPVRIDGLAADAFWLDHRPEIVGDIRGPIAASAIPKIEAAIRDYPYANYGSYRLWPGPNSNTFVASVLRAAPELEIAMPPEAIGKDYRADRSLVGRTMSETGIEASIYGLFGIKIGRIEGIEINVLGLVAGLDGRQLAVKIPAFGRIGPGRLWLPPSAIAKTLGRREAKGEADIEN
jgi:hypothetical protein